MTGLIIAVSVTGAIALATLVFCIVKMKKMETNLTRLAQCLLTYITHPESIDIVEDFTVKDTEGSDFNFPNSEGF